MKYYVASIIRHDMDNNESLVVFQCVSADQETATLEVVDGLNKYQKYRYESIGACDEQWEDLDTNSFPHEPGGAEIWYLDVKEHNL